jgi:SAM-dependent methyltransferase
MGEPTDQDQARDPRGVQSAGHWEQVYASGRDRVSWYEETPTLSTELLLSDGVPGHVLDVGAGASTLPDALLDAGVDHVTLLDLSMTALALTSVRLDERANRVTTIVADVLTHTFDEQYDAWHDRAVFHFLVEAEQRAAYSAQVRAALRPGGLLVVGTFAEDGPDSCSGLPVVRYDADALVAELGDGFTRVDARRAEHHTPWDSVQPFTWVVLRRG